LSPFYNAGEGETRHLLVYLHGHGSAPELVHPEYRHNQGDGIVRCCPRADLPTDGGWSWFDSGPRGVDAVSLHDSVSRVRAVVDGACADLGLRWTDVVLAGFSQGAAAALAVAATVDTEIGGLLLQAGFVPEVHDHEVALDRIRAGAILLQHGEDDEVVPAFVSKDLAGALLASGASERVDVELLDGGHTLSPSMLDGARRWLETVWT